MGEKQVQAHRILPIDGLKGISMSLIILYYFFQHIVPGGFLAINLSLLLAGFLNFRYFYMRPNQGLKSQSLSFYQRRLQRLFFPMLAMIVSTITFIWLFGSHFFSNLRNMALSSLLFINNYYQIISGQSYFVQAANPSGLTHLWFISLYAQLLLLTPLLYFIAYVWHQRPVIAANILLIISALSAILMAYLYRDNTSIAYLYYDLLTRLFAYTFGGALAFLLPLGLNSKPVNPHTRKILNGVGLAVFIFMCLMVCFMYGTQAAAYRYGMALFTFLAAVLLVVTVQASTIWYRIMSVKPLLYLGQRALHLYLWLYPIHLVVAHQLTMISSQFVSIGIQLALILLLAEASYRLFDQHQLILPFGQDFDWRAFKARTSFLLTHRGYYLIKTITIIYSLLLLVGLTGMFLAPESPNQDSQALYQQIQQNSLIVKESQTEDKDSAKVINNVEGLNRQELLHANALEITFIGDSILLASADQIKAVFQKATIEAEVGRQLYATTGLIDDWARSGMIQDTVVTFLGNNGTFTMGQLNDYIEGVGTDKEHFFITITMNRIWQKDVNKKLETAAKQYGNVKVIDWASVAANQKSWFYEDGIHLNQLGALELATYIAKQVYIQR